MLALCSMAGIGTIAGCSSDGDGGQTPGSEEGEPTGSETATEEPEPTDGSGSTEVTVSADGSIQAAIDQVAEGGSVVVSEGTYEESVTVTKPLTLTTSGGATLDGTDVDADAAVSISSSGVAVEGFEIIRYADGVRTTSEVEDVSVSGVTATDNDGAPIRVTAAAVDISDVVTESNGEAVVVEATRDGEVAVSNTEAIQNGSGGISVTGGSSVTMSGLNVLQNGGGGVAVNGGDARGQTVELRDSSVLESDGVGVSVPGTDGTDAVTVANTNVEDNGGVAATVTAETVELTDVTVVGHESVEAAVDVTSTREGEVTLTGTTVESTVGDDGGFTGGGESGHAVDITGGRTVTVENGSVMNADGAGYTIDAGEAREQAVEMTATAVEGTNSGTGVYVSGASEVTMSDVETTGTGYGGVNLVECGTATLENVTARATEDIGGLNLNAETVTVDGAEVHNNSMTNAATVDVTVLNGGEATIRNANVADSEAPTLGGEGGLYVRGGESVTVSNVSCLRTPGEGISVTSEDVLGQTVEITDSTAEGNEDNGVDVQGSDGDDQVTIESTGSNNNGGHGFSLGGEDVTIRNAEASGNESGALSLADIERSAATIENSAL